MKKTAQFSSLLKLSLGVPQFGVWPFLVAIGLITPLVCLVAVLSTGAAGLAKEMARGEFLGPSHMGFLGAIWLWMTIAVAATFGKDPGSRESSREFWLTRAVDRLVFLRAEAAAGAILVLVPLLVNYATSSFQPEMSVDLTGPGGALAASQMAEFCRQAFPATRLSGDEAATVMIPGGREVFSVWLVWVGGFLLCLGVGFHALIPARLRLRHWGGVIVCLGPLSVAAAFVLGGYYWKMDVVMAAFFSFAMRPWPLIVALILASVLVERLWERRVAPAEPI
jgi:hypothetical protein